MEMESRIYDLNENEKITAGGTLAGLYLFSVPVFSYSEKLGLSKLPQYIGIVIIAYALFVFLKNRTFIKSKFALFYPLFIIWSAITWSYAPHQSESEVLMTLVKVGIISVSIMYLVRSRKDFNLCLLLFLFSVFVTSILNFTEISDLRRSSYLTDDERFAGTFSNANTAATYCLIVIWAGLMLLFNSNKKRLMTVVVIAAWIISAIIIVYSGSRKGFIGIFILFAGGAWLSIKNMSKSMLFKFLATACSFILVFFVIRWLLMTPFFYRLQTMFAGESSSLLRMYLFREAMLIWSSSLKNIIMGIGFDNFRFLNDYGLYSHSTVAETLVCTGLIGFILYFSALASLYVNFAGQLKYHMNKDRSVVILILVLLFLTLFLNTAAVMYDDRLFMPLLGIIASYSDYLLKSVPENIDFENTSTSDL